MMSYAWRLTLCLLLLALPTANSFAEAVHRKLFESGRKSATPTVRYDWHLAQLKPGDVLEFGDGETFRLEKVLGGDSQSKILALEGGDVIRIPLSSQRCCQSNFRTLDGYRELQGTGLEIAQVDIARSSMRGEYVMIERIHEKMTFPEFLRAYQNGRLNTPEGQKIYEGFRTFVRQAALFYGVGDFHSQQVVWDGRRWVLIDWSDENEFVRSRDFDNLWTTEYERAGAKGKRISSWSSLPTSAKDDELTVIPFSLADEIDTLTAQERQKIFDGNQMREPWKSLIERKTAELQVPPPLAFCELPGEEAQEYLLLTPGTTHRIILVRLSILGYR